MNLGPRAAPLDSPQSVWSWVNSIASRGSHGQCRQHHHQWSGVEEEQEQEGPRVRWRSSWHVEDRMDPEIGMELEPEGEKVYPVGDLVGFNQLGDEFLEFRGAGCEWRAKPCHRLGRTVPVGADGRVAGCVSRWPAGWQKQACCQSCQNLRT